MPERITHYLSADSINQYAPSSVWSHSPLILRMDSWKNRSGESVSLWSNGSEALKQGYLRPPLHYTPLVGMTWPCTPRCGIIVPNNNLSLLRARALSLALSLSRSLALWTVSSSSPFHSSPSPDSSAESKHISFSLFCGSWRSSVLATSNCPTHHKMHLQFVRLNPSPRTHAHNEQNEHTQLQYHTAVYNYRPRAALRLWYHDTSPP